MNRKKKIPIRRLVTLTEVDPAIEDLYYPLGIDCWEEEDKRTIRAENPPEKPKENDVPRLEELTLPFVADKVETFWRYYSYLDRNIRKNLDLYLPLELEIMKAVRMFDEHSSYWKRRIEETWPYEHLTKLNEDNWKTFYVEKYFGERIDSLAPKEVNYRKERLIAMYLSPYITKLSVSELKCRPYYEKKFYKRHRENKRISGNEALRKDPKFCPIKCGCEVLHSQWNRGKKFQKFGIKKKRCTCPRGHCSRLHLSSLFELLPCLRSLSISFGCITYGDRNVCKYAIITYNDFCCLISCLGKLPFFTHFKIHLSKLDRCHTKILSYGIKNMKYLETLELNACTLTDHSAKYIKQFFTGPNPSRLKNLNLNSNILNDDGIKLIADGLILSQTLKTLDLSRNYFEDEGVEAIARAVMLNKSLETIRLGYLGIKEHGMKCIAHLVYNSKTLLHLDTSCNKLKRSINKDILDAINANDTLLTWNLGGCELGEEIHQKVLEKLLSNRLKRMNIGFSKWEKETIIEKLERLKANEKVVNGKFYPNPAEEKLYKGLAKKMEKKEKHLLKRRKQELAKFQIARVEKSTSSEEAEEESQEEMETCRLDSDVSSFSTDDMVPITRTDLFKVKRTKRDDQESNGSSGNLVDTDESFI